MMLKQKREKIIEMGSGMTRNPDVSTCLLAERKDIVRLFSESRGSDETIVNQFI